MSLKPPYYVTISNDIAFSLSRVIATLKPDKIAVLVDENTKKHCLPRIDMAIDEVIVVPCGEYHKTLRTCERIWEKLTKAYFSRKSLLINLGGGTIGDMGGFVASVYKRGIWFVNIPTTLLSAVDASIGGKLGVNFEGLKNHIGLFRHPDHVIINTDFFQTLPEREFKSGYAEIVKHSLIYDVAQWDYLKRTPFQTINWNRIIQKSIGIKNEIVNRDPSENGLRKILNFGHTLGHAIESHFLHSKTPLPHGEAVAIGMILESHLSMQTGAINYPDYEKIAGHLRNIYHLPEKLPSYEELEEYLHQDKKNKGGNIHFSILKSIGNCSYDITISKGMILNSLSSYNQQKPSLLL